MKNIDTKTIIIAITALLVGVFAGWMLFGGGNSEPQNHDHTSELSSEKTWTCSMHPQIRQGEPGDCPICGMELIPLDNKDGGIDPTAIRMSQTALQLANVQTMRVATDKTLMATPLTGKVQIDERRIFTESSHITGRIEVLKVNFNGDYVKKGQVIAKVYSPELVNAQEELFEAAKTKNNRPELYQASVSKLKNWKLSDDQISEILSSGTVLQDFPIIASVSGYVIKRNVNLGDYVKQGQPLYEIADLSKVWILFDVYESGISAISLGDIVEYSVKALPGEKFTGSVAYIDPSVNPKTRVVQVRVAAQNKSMKLKPEMFVTGIISGSGTNPAMGIAVPTSALMWTGKRSVVYVKQITDQGISFSLREVVLGARAGENYIIKSGLQAGEEIAVNGTFSIDAAAQLAGKPSMMNPAGGIITSAHNHNSGSKSDESNNTVSNKKVSEAIKTLIMQYFDMKNALVGDDLMAAKKAAGQYLVALNSIDMAEFDEDTHRVWMEYGTPTRSIIEKAMVRNSIGEFRADFLIISQDMIELIKTINPFSENVFVQFCPMADNNKGANWLSLSDEVLNPYFGRSMLKCGEVIETL